LKSGDVVLHRDRRVRLVLENRDMEGERGRLTWVELRTGIQGELMDGRCRLEAGTVVLRRV
jgi:hypothetical protein